MTTWNSEYQTQIELQNLLENLDTDHIEYATQVLSQSTYSLTGFHLITFAFHLVSSVGIRPQKIDNYISLISNLVNTQSTFDLLPNFIFRILKSRICDKDVYSENSAEVLFYVKMVINHLIPTYSVLMFFKELMDDTPQYFQLLFWVFILISPILKTDSPATYIEVSN